MHSIEMGKRTPFVGQIVKKMPVYMMGVWAYAYSFHVDGVPEPIVWNGGQNLGLEGAHVTFSAKPKEWIEPDGIRTLVIRHLAATGATRVYARGHF